MMRSNKGWVKKPNSISYPLADGRTLLWHKDDDVWLLNYEIHQWRIEGNTDKIFCRGEGTAEYHIYFDVLNEEGEYWTTTQFILTVPIEVETELEIVKEMNWVEGADLIIKPNIPAQFPPEVEDDEEIKEILIDILNKLREKSE